MMSETNHLYEAWEERYISEEKGKRVVHYYLRSSSGRSLLAVVGTEKSRRHMLYMASEEFLQAFRSNTSIDASKRWRARRDVVQWLISLVRKDDPECTVANIDLVPNDEAKDHVWSGKEQRKIYQENPANTASQKVDRAQELESGMSKATIAVADRVEVLCQDSGMRGCWFRCKVEKVLEKRFKVQYVDVEDVEGVGKLQEWLSASRVATPVLDKLGMRYSGRLAIRPCPPKEPSSFTLQVGTSVDAWWCNGWWEGVVIGVSHFGENRLHVYLPGEGKLMTVERNDTRISRDWVDGRWVDIMPKPDVVPIICSSLKPDVKLPTSSTVDENSQKISKNLKKRIRFSDNDDSGHGGSADTQTGKKKLSMCISV